jgi:hypothetical protein
VLVCGAPWKNDIARTRTASCKASTTVRALRRPVHAPSTSPHRECSVASRFLAGSAAHAEAMAGHSRQAVLDPASGREADNRHPHAAARLALLTIGLLISLAVVALLTLTPEGQGWAWGSPTAEARWYLTGLDSTATTLQLAGNLALLAVPAALAVLRRPQLGRLPLLAGLSLAVGTGIEVLQWALPLGRVVSPLDAVLNATGAIVGGRLAAHLRGGRAQPAAA